MSNGTPHNGGGGWPPPRRRYIRRVAAFVFTLAGALVAYSHRDLVAGSVTLVGALLQLPDVLAGPEAQR